MDGSVLQVMTADRDALTRLAFDLHDGPLQTLAALRRELRAFRDQLAGAVDGVGDGARIVARVGDLDAYLTALDDELRDLISAASSPEVLRQPTAAAVAAAVEQSRGACAADVTVDPALDRASLADREKLGLVRIVRAAVSNAASHAGTDRVAVAVRVLPAAVEAEVSDAGCGFDVETAFAEAAARGRLGLIGMRERARSLGAVLEVESGPRGTRVLVRLPL